MKMRVHSSLGCVVVCAGLLAGACGRPVSERQSALAPADLPTRVAAPAPGGSVLFPLVGGSFAIQNRAGDGISGTYTGSSTGPGPDRNSSLSLLITTGWGAFAGAAGSLGLSGTGAFTGEGAFALDGSGEVVLAGGKRVLLVVNLHGRSSAGCSPSQQIAISQTADGIMGRAGKVVASLDHVIENTGCVS